jgi:sec-independent protein translocase protein TatC
MEELDDSRMPLWEHLGELRSVLIRSIVAFLLGLVVTYNFSEPIVQFLERPLLSLLPADQSHLYFTGVADKFIIYFKVAAIAAFALTSPYILFQVWSFISPALYRREKRFVVPFLLSGTGTFLLGLAFAYYVLIPFGYRFLIRFGSAADLPLITLGDYFDLTLKLLMLMGLVFQLPVLLVLLARFGWVRASFLSKYRRHAIVALSVVAAVITPNPDVFTIVVVMIPLYGLYEISIIAVRLFQKKEG